MRLSLCTCRTFYSFIWTWNKNDYLVVVFESKICFYIGLQAQCQQLWGWMSIQANYTITWSKKHESTDGKLTANKAKGSYAVAQNTCMERQSIRHRSIHHSKLISHKTHSHCLFGMLDSVCEMRCLRMPSSHRKQDRGSLLRLGQLRFSPEFKDQLVNKEHYILCQELTGQRYKKYSVTN